MSPLLRSETYRVRMAGTRRTPRTRRTRSTVAAVLGGVLVLGLGTGCSLLEQAPAPEDAARALATGLAKADLARVTFSGSTTPAAATAFVAKAYQGLGTLRPEVTVTAVKAGGNGDEATATLQTRWDISDSPTDWTYASTVPMRLVDNVWHVSWSPGIWRPSSQPTRRWRCSARGPAAPTSSMPMAPS